MLQRRAELLRQLRAFFEARGFWEVETPLLSQDSVIDRHLDPFSVTLFADAREPHRGPTYYLQTSPEFAMKRLLAAWGNEPGEQPLAIYQIGKAFRGGERGQFHNPEFTMVEWYRVGDDYQAGMQFLSDLAATFLQRGMPERVTYRAAFQRYLGFDPLTIREEELREQVRASGLADDVEDLSRHALLDFLLVTRVEPQLGTSSPTILCDYPTEQAALACVTTGAVPVAERFELYVAGMELANGYHELLDPAVLEQRNQQTNRERIADGKPPLPEDSLLVSAMKSGLPPCSGCALGFDRLLMAITGARTIEEIIAFPSERA